MTQKWLEIDSKTVQETFRGILKKEGEFRLLSTITGYQDNDKICIIYHLLCKEGPVNIRTSVPMSNPVLESLTPVLPGAVIYEREIQDILGVTFTDIIDSRRMILPEDWPDKVYPLRKDFVYQKEEKKNG